MVERKVTIHDSVVEYVAKIAFYIEGKGLNETAKKFVDEAFTFFEGLGDKRILIVPAVFFPGGSSLIAVPHLEESIL